MKKYEILYRKIKKEIETGILPEGERLLSIREESLSSELSINTVIKAYEILADEGLIRVKEKGGYYVRKGVLDLNGIGIGIEASQPQSHQATAREVGERIDQLYERLLHVDPSFASAAPGLDLLPVEQLNQAASRLGKSWLAYENPEGDHRLRQRISLINQEIDGPASFHDIIITNGATEALAIVVQSLLRPGDTIALESPCYFNYFRQLSPAGINIVEIPVGKDGLDLGILEKELREKRIRMILTQPNVQNPTGITMSEKSKEDLIALAVRYDTYLVQDDVFGDLFFAPYRPRNLSFYSDYSKIILVSSYSKSIAPGLRVGWIRSFYSKQFAEVKLRMSMDTSGVAQSILAEYLGTKAHRRHLQNIRKALQSRIENHLEFLSEILPSGCFIRRPSGGCLLWIVFPKGIDATMIFERAAWRGLITAPGAIFTSSDYFSNCIRLNTGYPLTSKRSESLSILGDF